jgi:hypothetical protein
VFGGGVDKIFPDDCGRNGSHTFSTLNLLNRLLHEMEIGYNYKGLNTI